MKAMNKNYVETKYCLYNHFKITVQTLIQGPWFSENTKIFIFTFMPFY